MAFRRDVLFALPFLVIFSLPSPQVEAGIWEDLWLTPNQQAQRLLEQGDAAAAAELFESPDWKAYAEYEAENFEASLNALSESEDPSLYNLGTSLAMNGQLEESLETFNEFLETNPDHEDAIYNRDIVQLLLDQQEQEQQQGQNSENQQSENSDQQQAQNGQQGQQEGQEGQQSQQNQEGQQNSEQQQANQGQDEQSQSSEQQAGSEQELGETEQASASETSDEEDENGNESASQEVELAEGEESNEEAEGEAAIALVDTPEEMSPASEQFLRAIPDDPSGLLRQKFEYESQLYQQQRRFAPPSVPGQASEERY